MTDDQSPGTAKSPKLIKAGCGFRYDPEELSPETGFNFEAARELLNQTPPEDAEENGKQKSCLRSDTD